MPVYSPPSNTRNRTQMFSTMCSPNFIAHASASPAQKLNSLDFMPFFRLVFFLVLIHTYESLNKLLCSFHNTAWAKKQSTGEYKQYDVICIRVHELTLCQERNREPSCSNASMSPLEFFHLKVSWREMSLWYFYGILMIGGT